LLPRSPYKSRGACYPRPHLSIRFEAKHVPRLETLISNIGVFGVKTRSRGTPLPVAIVRQPAATFIRNHFHIRSHMPCSAFHNRSADGRREASTLMKQGKGGNPFSFLAAFPKFPPPPRPPPPKY